MSDRAEYLVNKAFLYAQTVTRYKNSGLPEMVEGLIKAGWNDNDIVTRLLCTEEVNPTLSEKAAEEVIRILVSRNKKN